MNGTPFGVARGLATQRAGSQGSDTDSHKDRYDRPSPFLGWRRICPASASSCTPVGRPTVGTVPPVNVFPRADGYVIALTYGRDSDWVRNVLADGGCTLETRGRTLRLSRPRLFRDERLLFVPAPLRLIPRLGGVFDFLELKLDDGALGRTGTRGAG